MTYYVKFDGGCTIVKAARAASAAKYCRDEFGREREPFYVRPATNKDIAWVRAMGGIIHDIKGKVSK